MHSAGEQEHDPGHPSPERRRLLRLAAVGSVCVLGGGALGRATGTGPGSAVDRLLGRTPPRTDSARRRLAVRPDAIVGVRTDERVIALSLDDGPDVRHTPQVLDLLAARKLDATFFDIGVNVAAHPDLVLQTAAAGHSLGSHTHTHPTLDQITYDEAFTEIAGGRDDLTTVCGERSPWFRPPKGMVDDALGAFAASQGLQTVFWSWCLENYLGGRTPEESVRDMLAIVRPGDIVLAHDGGHVIGQPQRPKLSRARTLQVLPLLLQGLEQRGYRVIDVPRLLELGPARTLDDL